jgi:hypothetical protein
LLQQIGSHLHLSLWNGAGSTFPDSADDRGLGLFKAGTQILTAADPLSTNVLAALSKSVYPAAEAPLAQIDNVQCKAPSAH